MAANFTLDWIKRRWRERKREKRALRGLSESVRDESVREAPTDEELKSLMQELEGVLSHKDIDHLRQIAGFSESPASKLPPGASTHPVSPRTERRWKEDLERKVRKHLGFSGQKPHGSRRKRKK
jgi:hypothetical protein